MSINITNVKTGYANVKNFILKHSFLIIAIIIAILVFITINQHRKIAAQKKEIAVYQNNVAALNDTIRITKAKNGIIEFNKLAFIADKVANLEKVNKELADAIKNIKGDVKTIIKSDIKLVHDTVTLVTTGSIKDSIATVHFNFNKTYSPNNYRIREGYTNFNLLTKETSGELTKDEIGFSVTTGIKKVNKRYEIFVEPDYPGMQVTKLNGAVIDETIFGTPKVRKLSIGVNVGYHPFVYDLGTKQFSIKNQFSGGVGLNYKLF